MKELIKMGSTKKKLQRRPAIIINFKTYKSSSGKHAEELARAIRRAHDYFEKKKKRILLGAVVQPADIYRVSKIFGNRKILLLSEHADPIMPGRNTGYLSPYDLKEAGAEGTLLNHSEHRIRDDKIIKTLSSIREGKLRGFKTIICVTNLKRAEELSKKIKKIGEEKRVLYFAWEPPSLIGGKISVSNASPGKIIRFSEEIRKKGFKTLVGAGIHTHEDFKRAVELGADGVLLASGFTLSKKPYYFLKELALGE